MRRQQSAADPAAVVLAMTEMVSNAVRYGADPVDIELSADGTLLLLRVTDCSDDLPRQSRADQSRSGGRGMIVVSALASRWGVQYLESVGKTVWCEFRPVPLSSP
jgi:two-component sensor histidine kinase